MCTDCKALLGKFLFCVRMGRTTMDPELCLQYEKSKAIKHIESVLFINTYGINISKNQQVKVQIFFFILISFYSRNYVKHSEDIFHI